MITKFKIFEKNDKGKEIIYTFINKAITKSEYGKMEWKYDVNILLEKPMMYDNGYKYILSIESTPGAWYVNTLLDQQSNSNRISIQGDWYCDNWQEIMEELLEILPSLDSMIYSKKYNL